MNHNKHCGSYSVTPNGPPIFWVPPCVSLPPIPPSSKYVPAHILLKRGGAAAAAVRFVHPGVLVVEPTSLMRKEGLITALWGVAGMELGC